MSLSATPLSATPLSATPLSATPLSATPLSLTPLSATPLSATPLSSTPLSVTPLSATPLSPTPLSVIPLSEMPLSEINYSSSRDGYRITRGYITGRCYLRRGFILTKLYSSPVTTSSLKLIIVLAETAIGLRGDILLVDTISGGDLYLRYYTLLL
jgi:hypothetical protein